MPGGDLSELFERRVDVYYIGTQAVSSNVREFERHNNTAPLFSLFGAGVVHQDPPHRLRSGCQEVLPVIPVGFVRGIRSEKAQKNLVDQSRSL